MHIKSKAWKQSSSNFVSFCLKTPVTHFPPFVSLNPHTTFHYHTYFFLSHTHSTDYLLFFSSFFSLTQKTYTHKHTQTTSCTGFRCGHKSSEWVAMIPPAPAEPGGGRERMGGWRVEHRAGGPVRRLQLNGCPRFLCLSKPERATAQPLGAKHRRLPTSVTEAHGLINPL